MQKGDDPWSDQHTEKQGGNRSESRLDRDIAKNIKAKKGIPKLK
jgi:hypothetical protein